MNVFLTFLFKIRFAVFVIKKSTYLVSNKVLYKGYEFLSNISLMLLNFKCIALYDYLYNNLDLKVTLINGVCSGWETN